VEGVEGVIAAIEAGRAKQQALMRARQAAPQAPAPQAAVPPAAPVPPKPPVSVRPPEPAAPAASAVSAAAPRPRAGLVQAMFEDGNSLLKAVAAAEILGPPAALREHHLWNHSPNEPSI